MQLICDVIFWLPSCLPGYLATVFLRIPPPPRTHSISCTWLTKPQSPDCHLKATCCRWWLKDWIFLLAPFALDTPTHRSTHVIDFILQYYFISVEMLTRTHANTKYVSDLFHSRCFLLSIIIIQLATFHYSPLAMLLLCHYNENTTAEVIGGSDQSVWHVIGQTV